MLHLDIQPFEFDPLLSSWLRATQFGLPVIKSPNGVLHMNDDEFAREFFQLMHEIEGIGFPSYQQRLDNKDCEE